MTHHIDKERLEYLRSQIEAECISWGEVGELQGLAGHIEDGDTLLLGWAGIPEGATRCEVDGCQEWAEYDGLCDDCEGQRLWMHTCDNCARGDLTTVKQGFILTFYECGNCGNVWSGLDRPTACM